MSTVVHVSGVLVAWATYTTPGELPRLPGNTTAVELTAMWVEPEPPTPVLEILPAENAVVVMPSHVRIGGRTYSRQTTSVLQPTPDELAMADRMIRLPEVAAARRSPIDSVQDRSAEAPPPRLAPHPQPASIPARRTMAQPSASAPVRQSVGTTEQTPARLLENRPPSYPSQAVIDRLEGTVLLRVHISSEGHVAKLEILSSSGHPILDAAAAGAVRTWRFAPARQGNRPVATTARLPVRFSLDSP